MATIEYSGAEIANPLSIVGYSAVDIGLYDPTPPGPLQLGDDSFFTLVFVSQFEPIAHGVKNFPLVGLPDNAIITGVDMIVYAGAGGWNLSAGGVTQITAVDSKGVSKFYGTINDAVFFENGIIQTYTMTLPEAPDGTAWTAETLRTSEFGLASGISHIGPTPWVYGVEEIHLNVSFLLEDPIGFSTAAATGVASDRAILNAAINPNGATSENPIMIGFGIAENPAELNNLNDLVASTPAFGNTAQIIGQEQLGLVQNTTYYFRAFAQWDTEFLVAANIESFRTLPFESVGRIF